MQYLLTLLLELTLKGKNHMTDIQKLLEITKRMEQKMEEEVEKAEQAEFDSALESLCGKMLESQALYVKYEPAAYTKYTNVTYSVSNVSWDNSLGWAKG